MLTESVVLGAGDVPNELLLSPCSNFVFGLANDLNMSDCSLCSLFATDGLLASFFSTSPGRAALISGTTAAWDVNVAGLSPNNDRSDGLIAFF